MNESAEFRKAVYESLITYKEIIEKFRIGEKKKYCTHPDLTRKSYFYLLKPNFFIGKYNWCCIFSIMGQF